MTNPFILIPHQQLAPETLQHLIEEFVTRDGTDYGLQESSLASKVRQVQQQLNIGKVVIVFNTESNSCNIVDKSTFDLASHHDLE